VRHLVNFFYFNFRVGSHLTGGDIFGLVRENNLVRYWYY